jgi:epoxide hydrolase-like predicted phosphatase
MTIRAVVFDIGGVLESNPSTGWERTWEERLHLQPGELNTRLSDVWEAGGIGAISEGEVEQRVGERLGLDQAQLHAFMADLWNEYVGTLNTELAAYFASLRPRYQTAILSNSFVGAREKEEELYHFAGMCDLIIYSHEEGISKPERRIFALTCERLGVQPAEMVFLDDVAGHVAAAQALGIQAILFKETAQAIADINTALRDRRTGD